MLYSVNGCLLVFYSLLGKELQTPPPSHRFFFTCGPSVSYVHAQSWSLQPPHPAVVIFSTISDHHLSSAFPGNPFTFPQYLLSLPLPVSSTRLASFDIYVSNLALFLSFILSGQILLVNCKRISCKQTVIIIFLCKLLFFPFTLVDTSSRSTSFSDG